MLKLLVQDLETVTKLPAGEHRPPLCDWIVLGVPTETPGHDRGAWARHLRPKPTQFLAFALVGLGPDRNSWDGAIVRRGQSRPLDAIRIVGPGMITARRTAGKDWWRFGADELQHWSRTRGALGDDVWRKVWQAHVLLLVAGRNGSAMAYRLVALGIRSLTIVDPDHVRIENLDACYTCTEADSASPKPKPCRTGCSPSARAARLLESRTL